MQQYQFERIYSQMEKEFGKVKKGEEESRAMMLFPMESNALKIHRLQPKANSRRMREAIALVLFDIKGNYEGKPYDTENLRDEGNRALEKALLMAFDPFTNDEIRELMKDDLKTMDLREYYREPIRCLLRIKDAVDLLEKNAGADGYFEFIESHMGSEIEHDEQMHFSILRKSEGLSL